MSLALTGSVWESSSLSGSIYSTAFATPEIYYWSSSLPAPFDSQISSSAQLTTKFFQIGDTSTNSIIYGISASIITVDYTQNNDINPGVIFSIDQSAASLPQSALLVNYTNISISYQLVSGSLRRGIYANQISGSPQLSLEPLSGNLDEIWAGDIWFLSSSQYSGSIPSLRIAEEIVSSSISASITQSFYTTHITYPLMGRIEESSSIQIFNRFETDDRPINTLFAANSYATDGWFETINITAVSGTGWRNIPWSGGIYMPNSGTVGIYGGKIFNVDSGKTDFSGNLYTWPITLGASGTFLSQDGAGNLTWVFTSGSTGASSISSSYATTASYASVAQTLLGSVSSASWAAFAVTASAITTVSGGSGTGNATYSGTFTGSVTGNLLGNASTSTSASFAVTAAFALTGGSGGGGGSGNGTVASGTIGQFVFYSGSQIISGSPLLGISGSMLVLSASVIQNTGSFQVSGATVFAGNSYTWPISYGASGTFLSQDGAGNFAWAFASGSSGGSVIINSYSFWDPTAPQIVSTSLDDNFNGSGSIGTNWQMTGALFDSGTGVEFGRLRIYTKNRSTSLFSASIYYQNLPASGSGSWTIVTKQRQNTPVTFGLSGLMAMNGDTGKFYTFGLTKYTDNSYIDVRPTFQRFSNLTTRTSVVDGASTSQVINNGTAYIKLRSDGTNIIAQWSYDGIDWTTFFTETLSSFMGTNLPNKVGLYADSLMGGAGSPGGYNTYTFFQYTSSADFITGRFVGELV